jgi:hypothetical protein
LAAFLLFLAALLFSAAATENSFTLFLVPINKSHRK